MPGRRIACTNGRRLVSDILRIAKKVPSAAVLRDLQIGAIAELRKNIRPKLSWNAILIKAYSIVAAQNPTLRSCYVGFPWPHYYEHHENVCMLAVTREYCGESRLLFGRIARPEVLTLFQLQAKIDQYRRSPVRSVKQFRHQIRFAKWPLFMRRLGYWCMFNLWPSKRMSHTGTFGVSLSTYNDAYGTKHLGINTVTLGIDPLPKNNVSRLLFTFDHQVLDGHPAVLAIEEMYRALHGPVLEEMKTLAAQCAAIEGTAATAASSAAGANAFEDTTQLRNTRRFAA